MYRLSMHRSTYLPLNKPWNTRSISPDLRQRAIWLFQQQKNPKEIAERLLISESSVYRYIERYEKHGDVYSDKEMKQRHGNYHKPCKKVMDGLDIEDIVMRKMQNDSVAFLSEYKDELKQELGVDVSLSTLSRYFGAKGVTRKKVSILGHEGSPYDLIRFWDEMEAIATDANQLLFFDECSRDDHDSNRFYGRSLKGERCFSFTNSTRGGYRISLELAADYKGPVCEQVYEQGMDAEDFMDFCWSTLIDHISPYPGPHSILLGDNCRIHSSEEFDDFIQETHTVSVPLPSYMSWYNLCEWIFNAIRVDERRKRIKGRDEAIVSILESAEKQRGKNWLSVLERIGYC